MKCSRAAENSKQFLCAMACIQKADHKSSYWINAVLILPKECGHGHAPFRWSGGKSMRQTDLVESRFAASSFGRTAHDAGIDGSWHRKIAEARGDEVFAVERAKTSRRSEEHTSELQSRLHLVCRLLLEKKKQ